MYSTLTADVIASALGGQKAGRTWMVCCPAHRDRTPSLAIGAGRNGKVLVHCHSGCSQSDVIKALRLRGLWYARERGRGSDLDVAPTPPQLVDPARTRQALDLWDAASPAQGTLVEAYLCSRGITVEPPLTIRFHPGLQHPEGYMWPAMVALVTDGVSEKPVGVHRTFLARDGNGKAAVEQQKMMLGPCKGGVVRLAPPGDMLLVGEGIETCLSAMQTSGKPAWAALSTSGLRGLVLPPAIRSVTIIADGDEAGEKAAGAAGGRWIRERRRVRIARPPKGADFNDLLNVNRNLHEEGV